MEGLQRLQTNQSNIRNLCILAHVDHGEINSTTQGSTKPSQLLFYYKAGTFCNNPYLSSKPEGYVFQADMAFILQNLQQTSAAERIIPQSNCSDYLYS